MIYTRKLAAGLLLFFITGAVTFCSSEKNFRENYEGFMGHTLRVYSKVELPEREKDYSEKEVEAFLKDEARKRATILVTGFFQVHYHEMMREPRIVRELMKAFEQDVFIKKSCNDSFCSAFLDYNLKKVFEIINEKNKISKKPAEKKPIPRKLEKDEKKESGTP